MPKDTPYSPVPTDLYANPAAQYHNPAVPYHNPVLHAAVGSDQTAAPVDVFDDDPVRSLPGRHAASPTGSSSSMPVVPSPVLTLGWERRLNLVALRTVLAVVFVVCLGLDLGGVAPQRPQASLLESAGELGSPAFLGQVSLGAMFVLTGIMVTHFYLRRAPRMVWGNLVAQTLATLAFTVLPGVVLIALFSEIVAVSTVIKVVAAILPAWVLGCVSVAVVFRTHWAKANVTRIAPALMVVSMILAFVVGSSLSKHAPVVGTALWADPTFSWAQAVMCTTHSLSCFFAGSAVVAVGDLLLRRRTLQRFLLPVIGVVVFVVALPLAMAGLDVGPPFLALALLPAVMVPVPSLVAGRDLWIGLVLYGWPVHLMFMTLGATQWSPMGSAVLGATLALALAAVSWRYVQRPVAKRLTRCAPQSRSRTAPEPEVEQQPEGQSARFRLLAVAEGDKLA